MFDNCVLCSYLLLGDKQARDVYIIYIYGTVYDIPFYLVYLLAARILECYVSSYIKIRFMAS